MSLIGWRVWCCIDDLISSVYKSESRVRGSRLSGGPVMQGKEGRCSHIITFTVNMRGVPCVVALVVNEEG